MKCSICNKRIWFNQEQIHHVKLHCHQKCIKDAGHYQSLLIEGMNCPHCSGELYVDFDIEGYYSIPTYCCKNCNKRCLMYADGVLR